jgi:hypothetical protein
MQSKKTPITLPHLHADLSERSHALYFRGGDQGDAVIDDPAWLDFESK